MELKLINLEKCFEEAIKQNRKYIGIKMLKHIEGEYEITIHPNINFKDRLSYYKEYFNNNLTYKYFSGVKIVGFTFGDTFASIEEDLIGGN